MAAIVVNTRYDYKKATGTEQNPEIPVIEASKVVESAPIRKDSPVKYVFIAMAIIGVILIGKIFTK